MKDFSELKKSIALACEWLTDVAQVKEVELPPEQNPRGLKHNNWQGAIRGEYSAATRSWDTFCPMWHTGQAIKALVMAWQVLQDDSLLDAAKLSGKFVERNRISDENDEDFGMLYCYEGTPGESNSSANLETIDGLFYLAEATGQKKYQNWAVDALRWLQRKSYKPGTGHFRDFYYPAKRQWHIPTDSKIPYDTGRPLLDDAMFLKGWQVTNDESLKTIAVETAETLLNAEGPSGNWIKYGPCCEANQTIHPRHAYWWGKPMLEVYKATEDERFLQCFYRSVDWYKQAMRKDGGIFRNTYTDFNTDSFGHAISGSASAVISFLEYYGHTGDKKILEYIEKGLKFCMKAQFTNPADLNLKGAILEKIISPDGTDRSPYHLRDLGSIFFIQAASLYIKTFESCCAEKKTEFVAEEI
jgi:rhamnogalacturonyl hydrolase YesR